MYRRYKYTFLNLLLFPHSLIAEFKVNPFKYLYVIFYDFIREREQLRKVLERCFCYSTFFRIIRKATDDDNIVNDDEELCLWLGRNNKKRSMHKTNFASSMHHFFRLAI